MHNPRLRRFLLLATVTALSATALIAIVALLAGDFDDTELRIMATTAGFGFSALVATRGTALLEQRRYLPLAYSVVVLAAVAFLIELVVLWFDDDAEAGWKSYVISIAWAVALGQIAGMIARRRPSDPPANRPIAWSAGICAIVIATMGSFAALGEVDVGGYYQALGVVVILDVLGVVLQPVVRRLGAARPVEAVAADRFVLQIADGRRIERTAGNDLPESVARALREVADRGGHVCRIELGG